MVAIEKIQTIGYLILQAFLILTLLLLPKEYIFSGSVVMLLLGVTLLVHSYKLIEESNLSNQNIYAFILILITIFFIPAYAAFQTAIVKFVGIALIIAHLVSIFIFLNKSVIKLDKKETKKKNPKFKDLKKEKEIFKAKPFAIRKTESLKKLVKKKPKKEYKLAAIVGGSKFHSLDCKMIENKSKKKMKYYTSAQEALNEGLKPCKLCKAVNYLHQL